MKIFKKAFPVLLAVVLLCATSFGCSCGKKKKSPSTPVDPGEITVPDDPNTKEEIGDTDKYIIKDGKSDYQVVLPQNAASEEALAAGQFVSLFKEATGIELPTVRDNAIDELGEGKYILFGDTKFSAEYKPSIAEYTNSGYRIATVNNSVIVAGTTAVGTRFGQIRLCEYMLGYEFFYPQVYSLDKNVTELKLMNYDVRVKPHLEYNRVRYDNMTANEMQCHEYSMRMSNKSAIAGRTGHAALGYAPIVLREQVDPTFVFDENADYSQDEEWGPYQIEHWKWYRVVTPKGSGGVIAPSLRNNNYIESQFCYTAHGDEQEYDALTDKVADTIVNALLANRNANGFDFSPADNKDWCECAACKADEQKYGAKSGPFIKMINDACAKVDKWIADNPEQSKVLTEEQRNFLLEFYAYFSIVDAPVVKNKDGEYEATVRCGKHVYPKIADITANYTRSIYHSDNDYTRGLFDTWALCSDRIAAYTYCARYNAQLVPFDTINAMQDWYKYLAVKAPVGNYNLGFNYENGIPGGWSVLRTYLGSKWGVDANLDKNTLLDKFFRNVYKDGAKYMRQVFDEYSATEEYNRETQKGYSTRSAQNVNIRNAAYWSKGSLTRWKDLVDQAIAAIEPMKATDPKAYGVIYSLMMAERLTYDYMLQQIYMNDMTPNEQAALARDLLDDIAVTGTCETAEAKSDIEAFKADLQSYIKGV